MADSKKDADKKPLKADKPADAPKVTEKPAAATPKPSSGGRLLVMLIGVVIVAFVIAVGGYEYFTKHDPNGAGSASKSNSGPSVGGPFTLVNAKGEEVTDKTFLGGYALIYFGYTYCPDVCPTALSDIASAMDMLGEAKASKITPIFISVDPARDTPEHMAEYVPFFHPRMVGLTGTEEQIKAVAREYRVYYRKNDPQGGDPQDYVVDHTSIIYLIGPDGKLVTHFSHGTTPEAMAERLGQLL